MKLNRIIEIGVLLFLIFWLTTVIIDFSRAKQDIKPIFCLRQVIYDYEDGFTKECLGMGYKVFIYERDAIMGYEFVPSWKMPKDKAE